MTLDHKEEEVLWLATTYPKNASDNSSVFLRTLCTRIAEACSYNIVVLAPDAPDISGSNEHKKGVTVRHYRYWPKKHQKLAYGDSILSNIKKKPWLVLQVVPYVLSLFLSAYSHVRSHRPALIHAHWALPTGLCAVVLGKWFHVPVLVTIHGGDIHSLRKGLGGFLLRYVVNGADRINAVSSQVKKDILDACGEARAEEIWVESMGVDEEKFSRIPDAKQMLGFAGDEKIILYVGRLSEKKGVECLVRASALLAKQSIAAKVVIVGSGNQEGRLRKLAHDLSVDRNLVFAGDIPNDQVVLYYSAADLFVAPSLYGEGFPVTIMEALMSGCTVVATEAAWNTDDPPPESVSIVTPGDEEALARSIARQLALSAPNKRIREALRFGLSRVAPSFCQEYDRTIRDFHR